MAKKYSAKFWIVFWTLATVFLGGWFLYWNTKLKGIDSTANIFINLLPIDAQQKTQYNSLAKLGSYLAQRNGQEKNLLILFQNNLEIRPGGGFIGAFGIAKIKNGIIQNLEIHDLSTFDNNIPNTIKAPYPIAQTMGMDFWKMRDSNFSPDFEINAKKAIEFYQLGNGQTKIDGVVGITSNVLTSVLKITGPVTVEGFPGAYDQNNAIVALEYQVEKAFDQQGIARDERKSIMSELAREIDKRIMASSTQQKIALVKVILEDLGQKDVQLYFADNKVQQAVKNAHWSGQVEENWKNDYIMTVDANLGAFKSDYYVKRSIEYTVDLSGEKPQANLKIIYTHTATQRDWMTRDYLTYLRVYVPSGSWLWEAENFDNPQFGNELGRKYFGAIVKVPLGTTKTVELKYDLPASITAASYDLMLQKQAGLSGVPFKINVVEKNGNVITFSGNLDEDMTLSSIET